MSGGGIFTMITNDGKQDEILLSKEFLKNRLNAIQAERQNMNNEIRNKNIARAQNGQAPYPLIEEALTLDDVEQTHYFPLISHFKPLVPMTHEYQRLSGLSQPSWGNEFTVQIQSAGELLLDAVALINIGAVTANNSAYWNAISTNPATVIGAELISYVNHPGHLIFSKAQVEINGNILDEYTPEIVNIYYELFLNQDRKLMWNRLVGQEMPIKGYSNVISTSAATGFYRQSGVRQLVSYVNGPQTPKITQPALNMAVPLMFWFNKDPSKALPVVSIPYGQRFYKLTIAKASDILMHHNAFYSSLDNSVNNPITQAPTLSISILQNNIFVEPNIHDILLNRISFTKIQSHRTQTQVVSASNGKELLSNLKWPVETIFIGFQPEVNRTGYTKGETWNKYGVIKDNVVFNGIGNGYSWGPTLTGTNIPASLYVSSFISASGAPLKLTVVPGILPTTILTATQLNQLLTRNGYLPLNDAPFSNPPTAGEVNGATPCAYSTSNYITYEPTVNKLYFTAQAINLTIQDCPNTFFSDYQPYIHLTDDMGANDDVGLYMYSFALWTDMNQPTGYINVSRAREFYINWESSYIGTAGKINMMIIAVAINFLLISEGSAVLRYAT